MSSANCRNCNHLHITRAISGTRQGLDCGKMASRIVCGHCMTASDILEWMTCGREHQQATESQRFIAVCPNCSKSQPIPSGDSWKCGHLGQIEPGEVVSRPAWCLPEWFEKIIEAKPRTEPAKRRKVVHAAQRSLFGE